MPIRVEILGRPGVRDDQGKPVAFPLGKPLALLGFLILEDRPVSRAEIADLLWPDSPRDKARQSARQAIWWIRRALGEETIQGTDPVELSREHVGSDVQAFWDALRTGTMDQARELWRGPLFAQLTLPNCRPWELWIQEQRDGLEYRYFRGLVDAAAAAREAGDPAGALPFLQDATAQNPDSVEAWTGYAECLLDLGRLSEARDILAEIRRRAEGEKAQGRGGIGQARADSLEGLEKRLRVLEAAGTDGGGEGRIGHHLEFVGRSEEMAVLRSCWKRARVGRVGVLTVTGQTGHGKTRLCNEFIAYAEVHGGHVGTARGYRSEAVIPYGTVADLVGSLLDLPGAAGVTGASDLLLRSIVPSKNGRGPGRDEGVPIHPAALTDALLDLVEAVAFEAPLVVFVDDLQWADQESRAALAKVTRRLDRVPCLFLFAERTAGRRGRGFSRRGGSSGGGRDAGGGGSGASGFMGGGSGGGDGSGVSGGSGDRGHGDGSHRGGSGDVGGFGGDGGGGGGHRSGRGVSSHGAHGSSSGLFGGLRSGELDLDGDTGLGGRRIDLDPLTQEEIGEMLGLLAEFSDAEAAPDVVRRIFEAAGGNPLFVGELLRAFADQGICSFQDGKWVLHVDEIPLRLELPDGIQALLEKRLSRVTSGGARILFILAREGTSLPPSVLKRETGMEDPEFFRTVAELERAEIVIWTRRRQLDFTHDQLRVTALARYQPRPEPSGWGSLPRPLRMALAAGMALAFVALAGVLFGIGAGLIPNPLGDGPPPPTWPYGQGRILVWSQGTDSALSLPAPAREGESWGHEPDPTWVPRDPRWQNMVAYRSPEGAVSWLGAIQGVDEAPYVARLGPGMEPQTLYKTAGDDGILDVSPLGTEYLISSENLETARDDVYDIDLVLLRDDNPDPVILYRGQDKIRSSSWSPDGQRIAMKVLGDPDTVVVLTPGGNEVFRLPTPEYRNLQAVSWCHDSRQLLLLGDQGKEGHYELVDTETGAVRAVPGDSLTATPLLCLGAGRGGVYSRVRDGKRILMIRDFQTGEVREIADLPEGPILSFSWFPAHPPPVVRAIRIEGADEPLPWGESTTVAVRGDDPGGSEGSPAPLPVVWSSSDPGVASITPEGVVTGNGTGETTILAEYKDWLRDSIQVQVFDDGRVVEDVLFRDTSRGPELSGWIVDTANVNPLPTVVEVAGEPVLSLNGDGQYGDVILSRYSAPIPQGATLELEFRLPFTGRLNKQRLQVCMVQLEEPDPLGLVMGMGTLVRVCFRYPSDEGPKLRTDLARVTTGASGTREVSVSPFLPSDHWVHLALQVRADGAVTYLLNREPFFQPPGSILLDPEKPWRIDLRGVSVDTDLWIRNLVLWRGERF